MSASERSSTPVAVFLAAGLGSRLQAVHAGRPKGLLELDGEPIVSRSARLVEAAGVSEIACVVGWKGDEYRHAWAARRGAVHWIENSNPAGTGSLHSLCLAAAALPGRDFLVLESDLVYEPRALAALLAGARDTLLVSGFTQSGDEVWVYASDAGQLRMLTKERQPDPPPLGEFVGISLLSAALLDELRSIAAGLPASAHYETGLNAVARRRGIGLLQLPDLVWGEIDDPSHLERVRRDVWPRIRRNETAQPIRP